MLSGFKGSSIYKKKKKKNNVDLCSRTSLTCNLWYYLELFLPVTPNPWFPELACFFYLATYLFGSPSPLFLAPPPNILFLFSTHCDPLGISWCFLKFYPLWSLWIGSLVGCIKPADMFGLAHAVLARIVFLKIFELVANIETLGYFT